MNTVDVGDLVDEVLKRYVTPVLREVSFKRSGAVYRLTAPNGDHAFFHVRRWTTSSAVNGFSLDFSVAVVPVIEWFAHVRGSQRPVGPEHALVHWQVQPPPEWAFPGHRTSPGDARWGMRSEDDVEACGAALAGLLRESEIPKLSSLLDRDALRAALREPPSHRVMHRFDPYTAQAVASVDDLPPDEVEKLIEAAYAFDPMALMPPELRRPQQGEPAHWKVLAWLRDRLAART